MIKKILKILKKIEYIVICIDQDIKLRYEIQKEVEKAAEERLFRKQQVDYEHKKRELYTNFRMDDK